MKIRNEKMNVRVLALAVQSALVAMCAMPLAAQADDEATAALKRPDNYVEIGAMNVTHDSAKFGEYNGLDEEGVYAIGNFDIRGGDAYQGGDGTMRWQVEGADLGTTSRSLGASVENQGQWSLGISFDELRHHITDSYQTPYQGNMGGDTFTLPAGFGVSPGNNTNNLTDAQKAAFHTEEIYTTRANTSFSAGYTFNPQWDVKFDYNHLNQTGAKLMAFSAMRFTSANDRSLSILPNPTDYSTDTIDLALNWAGDKAHVSAAYFGSFFRNDNDRVTFETFGVVNRIQTMSTAPDNDLHQLSLLGGYAFSEKTKLAGSLSYGRGTQDDDFVVDSFMMVTPAARSGADGKVITTHADLKLTDQTINKLTLTAGVKYDERDNKTPSDIYNFEAVSGPGADTANYPNTPYSNRKTQYELAGDYRLDNKQHIRLAYNRENIQRWCNDYAVGGGGDTAPYLPGTECVVATDSKEDKLSANYKLNATEAVRFNAGYSYADRNTHHNPNARTAMIEATAPGGGISGLNGGDFLGFHPFFTADRKQQMVKAGIDWQASEKLSLNLNGRYTDDDYDTQYGFQKGNSWSLNLDANFQYSDNGLITAYVTKEHRERDLTNKQTNTGIAASGTRIAVPAGGTWTNKLEDDDITFGLSAKHGGLVGGKLELAADLTYSLGETSYGTEFNYNGVDSSGRTCSHPNYLTCGTLPDVRNRLIQLKLSGDYKVSKTGKVAVGYLYQRLNSDDYFYNGQQQGTTPNLLMPTNQDEGDYSVNVISASYIYEF